MMLEVRCTKHQLDATISLNVTLKVPHIPILPMNDVKKSSNTPTFQKLKTFGKFLNTEISVYFNNKSASFTSRELPPTKILNLPVSNSVFPSASK
jgi:hypothetical protein